MSSPAIQEKPLQNPSERVKVQTLEIKGFRGIKHASIELGDVNVLIGANGAGKSNILSALGFLERVADSSFQRAISEIGGSNFVLYGGRKVTTNARIAVHFQDAKNADTTIFELTIRFGEDDLPVLKEKLNSQRMGRTNFFVTESEFFNTPLDHKKLQEFTSAFAIKNNLSQTRVYHFSDSSPQARIRQSCLMNDNHYLKSDAGNLAAFLYRFAKVKPERFGSFEALIKRIVPGFDRFMLSPDRLNETLIRLEYRDTRHDLLLTASYLSDGSLRFIALAALLYFNPPPLVIIDEPELGLHPTALIFLAELIQQASFESQIIVATQNPEFLNQFQPHQILVVEQDELSEETFVKRLDATELEGWLEDYKIGDLWLQNVLGGKP
jgi:predicted ATPase